MALRTWLGSILILSLLIAGWKLLGAGGFSPPLRSHHAEPAVTLPAGMVTVGEDGKTFHKPDCAYIHGAREVMDAETAARRGYAPCVRCQPQALKH